MKNLLANDVISSEICLPQASKNYNFDEIIKQDILRTASLFPFHAALLNRFEIENTSQTDTMGVKFSKNSNNISLYINPDFYMSQSPEIRVGLLKHEIYHVILGHLKINLKEFKFPKTMTVAMECSANEFIHEALPGAIRIEDYNFLPPLESTMMRYERLCKELANCDSGENDQKTLDDHSFMQNGSIETNCSDTDKVICKEIYETLKTLSEEKKETIDPLTMWAIMNATKSQDKQCGMEGSGKKIEINKKNYYSKHLPWEQILSQIGCTVSKHKHVLNFPNRRFPQMLGIIPGIRHVPCQPHIMAIIDTSGSISIDDLELIINELKCLNRISKITVVECDAKIQRTYSFSGKIENLKGRGGTDFNPPLQKEFLNKINPDVVIYFTDGCGNAPKKSPSIPFIWAITPGGDVPASWGNTLMI
ncbi:MAG: hypothetical protein HQK65_12280 [Desulfamplus sp.]|nr:hypothetical protein [Desulfamplus sp.]